jgi:hypothetical protein
MVGHAYPCPTSPAAPLQAPPNMLRACNNFRAQASVAFVGAILVDARLRSEHQHHGSARR